MGYETYTDQEIVAGILNNDQPLITFFFFKKCTPLFNYIIWNVFNGKVERKELINELYLYFAKDNWHKVRQFDFRSQLMTWTSVVATRFFIKKRDELIENQSSDALMEQNVALLTHEIDTTKMIDVKEAMARMPNERYRKVIELLYFKDIRPELLAEEMNITVDNLYNIHRRALVQLRLVMGRKEDWV